MILVPKEIQVTLVIKVTQALKEILVILVLKVILEIPVKWVLKDTAPSSKEVMPVTLI